MNPCEHCSNRGMFPQCKFKRFCPNFVKGEPAVDTVKERITNVFKRKEV
jgi:hypothetical protein